MSVSEITGKEILENHEKLEGESLLLRGWVRNVRAQKSIVFLDFNDGSSFKNIQLLALSETLDEKNFDTISKLGVGAAIAAEVTLSPAETGKQAFDLNILSWELLGDCPPDYPLQPKRHTPEFLRTIGHLRPRTNLYSAVFRVRSKAAFALHKFFNDRDFLHVHTPIITSSDSEGAGEMFKVTTMDLTSVPVTQEGEVDYSEDFFGSQAGLTVSGQLNAEAYALAFGKVYTFGPTFRAENSHTPRHASEFWMLEPEIAFADLRENMRIAEEMLKYTINYVMESCPDEMIFFNSFVDRGLLDRLNNVVSKDFAFITYTDAIKALQESGEEFKYSVEWGSDLQTEHERYLSEKLFGGPVFVTDYPKDIKAFYMKLNEDGKTVAAMDCLVPGIGEIIGGSQRETDYDLLLKRMEEMNLDPADYGWYLDLRKYGSVTHSGFGLGFERLIMYLTGVANIRDVIPFPRTPGHAEF